MAYLKIFKMMHAIDLLARPQGASLKEIAEDLNVSIRNVYRIIQDVEYIWRTRAEEVESDGREKRWKVNHKDLLKCGRLLPEFSLKPSELFSLQLLYSTGAAFRGTELSASIDSAFDKLGINPKGETDWERIRALFARPTSLCKDYSGKEHILEALTDAMLGRCTCLVVYDSFTSRETKTFKIDPLCFVNKDGGLYCFVRSTRHGGIILLAVERITELKSLREEFDYPEDFDPEAALAGSFGLVTCDPLTIRVRISADQARYVLERRLGGKSEVETHPDGSITLNLQTSGRFEVKRWLLGLGSAAVLLEPEDLRQELAAELNSMLASYPGSTD
ncbi:WYL domain-containing protein [Desulfocurvibacter africanus]|uniref:helix-turn-helix transcriptional regulator n=1 Tax=Desulfocurvibacter africanus TaxID=873 RepID=UPI002FDB07A5